MSSASKILAPETSFRLSGRKEIIFQLSLTAPKLQSWKHRIALQQDKVAIQPYHDLFFLIPQSLTG